MTRRSVRGDMLRRSLAQEAARIIVEHGVDDYLFAKRKAAERMGVTDQAVLPRNTEIEAALAEHHRLPLLATNGVLYAIPPQRQALDVFTCIRNHTHLDAAGTLLERNSERHLLKGAAEMQALFGALPEAIAHTERLADRLRFSLEDLGYEFPRYAVPAGETMDSFLRKVTWAGARARYTHLGAKVHRQIERELALIEKLGQMVEDVNIALDALGSGLPERQRSWMA